MSTAKEHEKAPKMAISRRWAAFIQAIALVTAGVPGACDERTVAAQPQAQSEMLPPGESTVGPNPAGDVEQLLDMDIEQLSKVDVMAPMLQEEVTTVTRQPSTVGKTPAAVFVITQEMIRRSGATNIPDVLRMAPGVEVARLDANKWAISIRGFNNLYAAKLLVQIDGRAVYSQFFSGVIWDIQDVVLQDVERIEVIRGPGATVWGANAVNGVINIITKSAKDTQGLLLNGGVGTEERGFSTLRYGGRIGDDLYWRAYGKQFERDGGYFPGDDDFDDWRQARGGFRADWYAGCDDVITFQGDFFDGDAGERKALAFPTAPFLRVETYDNHHFGENGLIRWTHTIDEDSDFLVWAYYDRYGRITPFVDLEQETFNVDFQHRFPVGQRHNVIWGTGYRHIDDHLFGHFSFSLDPAFRNTNLFSYFIQDEITLEEDRWYLTVGSKFEHNDFSGFEFQPSVRLLYTPNERESMWAAVSRAVQTPDRTDDDLIFHQFVSPFGPTFARITGNPDLEAEDLLAFETGYRAQPTDEFSWDLALFYNHYSDSSRTVVGAPFLDFSVPAFIVPTTLENLGSADAYGGELAATYQVHCDWQITGAYSLLYLDVHSTSGDDTQGSSAHNRLYVRSSWDLRPDLELDVVGRYVDNLPALGVESYFTMDVRIAWRPYKNFEWSIVGRNLLDSHHSEFVDAVSGIVGTEVQSEVYTMLTWTY
jgi:iron complex outermembrane receptor protein